MEFITIDRLSEDDFTSMIIDAGGKRYSENDSVEDIKNADYLLGSSIIELKLVEEEGFKKKKRQKKICDLFSQYWEERSVVVIDPEILNDSDKNTYERILEGPLKRHVKKASKQLKSTQAVIGEPKSKILIIVNNGYTALDGSEFRKIARKCAQNDTNNIDYVISCGIYYFSDGFDSFTICPFDVDVVQGDSQIPEELGVLASKWSEFLNSHMTNYIINPDRKNNAKLPVLDIEFDSGSITLIKSAPPFGKKSSFWASGRPRINTSGIDTCPPVATTFPKLSKEAWGVFKNILHDSYLLKDTYKSWIAFSKQEEEDNDEKFKPFVPVSIPIEEIDKHSIVAFSDLCHLSNEIFDKKVKDLVHKAKDIDETKLLLPRYVYLVTREIGRDQKNDLSSIYLVRGYDAPEVYVTIVEDEQIFFEYALALASSYSLKYGIDMVLYRKDLKYSWSRD